MEMRHMNSWGRFEGTPSQLLYRPPLVHVSAQLFFASAHCSSRSSRVPNHQHAIKCLIQLSNFSRVIFSKMSFASVLSV